ncbi:unnamed protein product [Owenia fusiformis]|uniref:Uncharacterized protein n=1 Tax=Owenia fusiformis TaxID=6347 RepID=A0A8S4PGE2_OWEFU|nr:unnamed protein product [Owenia fusiformis]
MNISIFVAAALVAVAAGQCVDRLRGCATSKARGYCTVDRYVLNYCRKTCGGCTKSAETTCWDKSTACRFYKGTSRCQSAYAKQYCQFSCNLSKGKTCGNVVPGTRPTARPTTRVTRPTPTTPTTAPTPRYTGPSTTPKPVVRQAGCGVSKLGHDKANFIVGGREAEIGRWPWMADLYNNRRHSCGAVVIDANWVLTAAHCVARASPYSLKIRVGWHNQRLRPVSGVEHAVRRIVAHKGYGSIRGSGILNDNDIALLQLTKAIDFNNEHVNVVCLPQKGEQFSGECTATGWGLTQGTGDNTRLREVTVPVYDTKTCLKYWPGKVSDRQICMGRVPPAPRQTACRGDSGGPLVCKKEGRWILAGVTSWGTRECIGRPAVYTRVSEYIDWIQQNKK